MSLRSVLILLFKDRVKNSDSDTRTTVVSGIRQSYDEPLSSFLLTPSLIVDENLVRISIFW